MKRRIAIKKKPPKTQFCCDNSVNYFYAAICMLGGKKAFLMKRQEIEKIEKYINMALAIEPKGIYYYFLAYIKHDSTRIMKVLSSQKQGKTEWRDVRNMNSLLYCSVTSNCICTRTALTSQHMRLKRRPLSISMPISKVYLSIRTIRR